MTAGGVIKRIIKASTYTQKTLAELLGIKTQSTLSDRLNQKNLSINLAIEMLEPLGYEIVFRPKDSASTKPSYVITTDDSDSTILAAPAAPAKSDEDVALEAKVEALVARYLDKLNGGEVR